MEIRIICEHDDGQRVRRHKKKRIDKKWKKRYGTYSAPLKPNQMIISNNIALMSRTTYKKLKRRVDKLERMVRQDEYVQIMRSADFVD